MATSKNYVLSENFIDLYLQKSSKFLYPLLGINSQTAIKPIQTYIAWTGEVCINDYKLVCVYDKKEDNAFKQFERTILRKNKYLADYKETVNEQAVYIFDLRPFKADVLLFLKGKYSQLSDETKLIILDFYKLNKHSTEYMDSYLNPEGYFEKYAALLNIEEWRIRDTGELCDCLCREKETFNVKKIGATNIEKLVLF